MALNMLEKGKGKNLFIAEGRKKVVLPLQAKGENRTLKLEKKEGPYLYPVSEGGGKLLA